MLYLIADGGSTKTEWCLKENEQVILRVKTQGLNPYFLTDEKIRQVIKMELLYPLRSQGVDIEKVKKIQYYGAGMRDEMKTRFQTLLDALFEADIIEVDSDLLGAAKALCGHSEGVAAILGTGSNSCLYDGEKIVKNIPSLGFILGDEELSDIIDKVYRQPQPNRYLAHAAKFIHRHLDCEPLEQLVIDNFRAFFRRNIAPYGRPDLPVNFVGSVAFYFEAQLRKAAAIELFQVGRILQSPLQ